MGGDNNLLKGQERVVGCHWLDGKHVEPGRSQPARAQRIEEGCLVHQTAPSRIDGNTARFHQAESLGVHQVCALCGQGQVQRDDIGLLQQLAPARAGRRSLGVLLLYNRLHTLPPKISTLFPLIPGLNLTKAKLNRDLLAFDLLSSTQVQLLHTRLPVRCRSDIQCRKWWKR